MLEDLGAPRTVQEVLYGTDREAATAALVATGSCLAQLQGLTYGREPEFLARQTALETTTTLSDSSLRLATGANPLA